VYTIAALVEELRPLLLTSRESGDPPYDVIVGHSLGGIVTAVLLPLLKSTRPVQVVLVDPPLEVDPESLAKYRIFFSEMVNHPQTPEELLQENPLWTKEDAVIANASMRLCGVEVVQAILDVGSFLHSPSLLCRRTPSFVPSHEFLIRFVHFSKMFHGRFRTTCR
jgi:hypothetical protein